MKRSTMTFTPMQIEVLLAMRCLHNWGIKWIDLDGGAVGELCRPTTKSTARRRVGHWLCAHGLAKSKMEETDLLFGKPRWMFRLLIAGQRVLLHG